MKTRAHELVARCLQHPEDERLVEPLLEDPDAAFVALTTFSGPYPEGMHAIDAGPTLAQLLTRVAPAVPRRVIEGMCRGTWAQRTLVMHAAAATEDARFTACLLERLRDRSTHVRSCILTLMLQHPHLRQPAALPAVEKVLTYKSTREHEPDLQLGQQVAYLLRAER